MARTALLPSYVSIIEPGDSDAVGLTFVNKTLRHVGNDVTVLPGREFDQQRCIWLKNVKHRYSIVANLYNGYEKPNSQHLLSKVSQHLSSDRFRRSAHPPITRQLKPDLADTSPYAVASSLIRGSSRGLLGQ